MRFVDADKQLEWVDCMTPIHGIGLEPVVAVETVRDLIKGAPTINAIPVEWLRGLMNILVTGDVNGQGQALFLSHIINEWENEQKEQEAK